MTLEEIGRKIKQHYPGRFDDAPDFDLGVKYVQENPAYRDVLDEGERQRVPPVPSLPEWKQSGWMK